MTKKKVGGRAGDLAESVGHVFRAAREQLNLSQAQVAALTEDHSGRVSRAMISSIERGRCLPGLKAMVSLTRVLHVEPKEILERVDLAEGIPVDAAEISEGTPRDLVRMGLDAFFAGQYRTALAYYDAASEKLTRYDSMDSREARELRVWIEIDRSVALRRAMALRAAHAAAQRAVERARLDDPARLASLEALSAALSQPEPR